jgi:hypothetical protein
MSSSGIPRRSAIAGPSPVFAWALEVIDQMRPKPPVAKRRRLGVEDVQVAGGDLVGDHADTAAVGDDQVDHLELVEELDAVLDAVLVERLQDHVARAVGRVAGAADRALPEVVRVAAEGALGDLAVGRAREREPHVLELDDDVDRLLAHHLDGVLVAQVVRALDGVEGVPLRVVLLEVAERRADPALGRAGVRAGRVELGDDRRLQPSSRARGRSPPSGRPRRRRPPGRRRYGCGSSVREEGRGSKVRARRSRRRQAPSTIVYTTALTATCQPGPRT